MSKDWTRFKKWLADPKAKTAMLVKPSATPADLHRGSLDYAEFVISPKNKDSTPAQIGDVIAMYMETLPEEDWSEFRFKVMQELKKVRKHAEAQKQ